MLVRPYNRGIDGMFLVGGRPKGRQRLEYRIPHPELAPAGEAHEGRILPYRSGRSRHGAPVRNTQRMPFIVRRLSPMAGPRSPRSGSKRLRMRHSVSVRSPRLTRCPPSRKAALNHSSMKKPSTRPSIYANDLKTFQGSKQVRQPLSDIGYDVVEQVCGGIDAGERHALYLLDVEDLRARVHQCELVAVRCLRQRLTRCPQEHAPRLGRAPACAVNFDVNHD